MGRCQDTNSQPLHKVLLSQCFMIDNLGITVCMECLLYSCTIAWFFVVVIIFFLYVICMMLKIMLSHILRLLCYLLSSLVGLTLPLVGHKISMLRCFFLHVPMLLKHVTGRVFLMLRGYVERQQLGTVTDI